MPETARSNASADSAIIPLRPASRTTTKPGLRTGRKRGIAVNSGSTVLTILRQARELLVSGKTSCIISAISSLKEQSSGRTRDLAYFAIMETMMLGGAETTISLLAKRDDQANALRMIEATIMRMT